MDVAILVLDLLPLEVEPGRKVEAVMEEEEEVEVEQTGESRHGAVLSPNMSIFKDLFCYNLFFSWRQEKNQTLVFWLV